MRRRFTNNHKTFDCSKYMTIEVLEDGYEVFFSRDVEYNLNGHKWVSLKANMVSPTLKRGDLLSLRCSVMPDEVFGNITGNGKAINLRGNILSLLFKDDINLDISGYRSVFANLFYTSGNNIISVEKNFLPATTLASNCYAYMFFNCTSLVTAPALPATTLAEYCYSNMFRGCKNLTTAPELPATTLVNGCYHSMFGYCEKLNYIKAMFIKTTSSSDTLSWVQGVASSGTFIKNKNATWNVTGKDGIPSGWTVYNDGEEPGGGINITVPLNDNGYGEFTDEQIEQITNYCLQFGESNSVDSLPDGFSMSINSIPIDKIAWLQHNGEIIIQGEVGRDTEFYIGLGVKYVQFY